MLPMKKRRTKYKLFLSQTHTHTHNPGEKSCMQPHARANSVLPRNELEVVDRWTYDTLKRDASSAVHQPGKQKFDPPTPPRFMTPHSRSRFILADGAVHVAAAAVVGYAEHVAVGASAVLVVEYALVVVLQVRLMRQRKMLVYVAVRCVLILREEI